MTDDTQLLQDAAERAKAVLPEPIAEVIAAHLGQHTTSHSVLDKPALARAVLAMPAPAVDREGLAYVIHGALCRCGIAVHAQAAYLPAADALITAGQVGGKRAVSEPGIRAADSEFPGDPEYLGGFIWGHLGGANVTPRQARSLADALIADGQVGGTDAQQRIDAALALLDPSAVHHIAGPLADRLRRVLTGQDGDTDVPQ